MGYLEDSSARLKVLGSEGSFVAGSIPAVPVKAIWQSTVTACLSR
ncbi:hypothetical protein SSUR61_0996 [Streptococcus suis R61]|uniref:Uncharacterized protein n=1 Tax=Streptococcus suis R61 TaxID=996306 RepID=A0AA87F8G6_STRSU|nr:hypothetical protein SSUR61_0996 [Streptococcus suis R61]